MNRELSSLDFRRVQRFIQCEEYRGYEGVIYHPTKYRMAGAYNVWADRGLLSVRSGIVHAIDFHEYSMATCGTGNRTQRGNGLELVVVHKTLISCRRCLVLTIADFLRDGVLLSICNRKREQR